MGNQRGSDIDLRRRTTGFFTYTYLNVKGNIKLPTRSPLSLLLLSLFLLLLPSSWPEMSLRLPSSFIVSTTLAAPCYRLFPSPDASSPLSLSPLFNPFSCLDDFLNILHLFLFPFLSLAQVYSYSYFSSTLSSLSLFLSLSSLVSFSICSFLLIFSLFCSFVFCFSLR